MTDPMNMKFSTDFSKGFPLIWMLHKMISRNHLAFTCIYFEPPFYIYIYIFYIYIYIYASSPSFLCVEKKELIIFFSS